MNLAAYGIQEQILAWIQNYLTGRVQCVIVNGAASPWIPGITQGSMLGPTLFVAFINDLPLEMQTRIQLLADDMKIYRPVCDAADKEALQANLDRVDTWADRRKLLFNESRCKTLHVGRSNSRAYMEGLTF